MGATRKYFSSIDKYVIPEDLYSRTLAALRRAGRDRTESTVYWAGSVFGATATITTLVVPVGPGVRMHRLQVRVSDQIIAAIDAQMDPPRRVLLAQVHTHAGRAFHSTVDDAFGFDTLGFISIVVPNFGRRGLAALSSWSFNECIGTGRYRELPQSEVTLRFMGSARPTEELEVHGN
jgi:hypothetical protein